MEKRTSVAYNNYDIIFRNMTEQFKDKAFDFYGIESAPIVRVEATDLHLEFQTIFKEVDLDRFLKYDVSANELFQKPIQTVVIYGRRLRVGKCYQKLMN